MGGAPAGARNIVLDLTLITPGGLAFSRTKIEFVDAAMAIMALAETLGPRKRRPARQWERIRNGEWPAWRSVIG